MLGGKPTKKRTTWIAVSVLVAVVAVAYAGLFAGQANDEERHRDQIETWFKNRVAKLTRPEGYLSIVGLYWLTQGRNTFGSDPSNDIVFPEKAPRFAGSFNVAHRTVTVQINPAIEITQNDRRVTLMELRPDTETERTVLEYGTMSWYVIIRGDKIGIRLRDRESHIRRGFEHIDRYPVDAHWRFEALLDKYEPMKFIPIDSVIDVVSNEPCIGAVVFEVGGETYRLDAIIEAHSPKLWVIFADETSGDETYGGGRYLYLDPPDDDGKLVIDFNVAENPPCAFSDYTTCPLPPPQNRLPIAVTAGEKTYRKHAE